MTLAFIPLRIWFIDRKKMRERERGREREEGGREREGGGEIGTAFKMNSKFSN